MNTFSANLHKEGCNCQSCIVDNLQTQIMENKFVDYAYTLYIPYVSNKITSNEMFQLMANLGKVQRLEVVPKLKLETGVEYYIAFVYFTEWFNTDLNTEIVQSLQNEDAKFQLFYNDGANEKYLNLKYNISPLAKIPLPKHFDLMLCVNKNINFEYLNQIITGLDIGQVNNIFVNTNDTHTNIADNYLWKGTNKSIWYDCMDTPDKLHHNVQISFSWWFHTEQAFLFQETLLKNGFIEIPVDLHTTFTFYLFRAFMPDQNPYIYYP